MLKASFPKGQFPGLRLYLAEKGYWHQVPLGEVRATYQAGSISNTITPPLPTATIGARPRGTGLPDDSAVAQRLAEAAALARNQVVARLDVRIVIAYEWLASHGPAAAQHALGHAKTPSTTTSDLPLAGVFPDAVDMLCYTGGSPGLVALVERISAGFPRAAQVRGDRVASVTAGLGLHARGLRWLSMPPARPPGPGVKRLTACRWP